MRPLAKARGCPTFLGSDSPHREFDPAMREASLAAAVNALNKGQRVSYEIEADKKRNGPNAVDPQAI